VARPRLRLNRREALAALAALAATRRARAFGQEGAFHPRVLVSGAHLPEGPRSNGPTSWSWELIRRTSAPARLTVGSVSLDSSQLLDEPFTVWFGGEAVQPLSEPERRGLRLYLNLGGVLFVDDSNPGLGTFGRSVRSELSRVLPESPVVRLPDQHVLYKSYYLLDRPFGRVEGPAYLEAIHNGKMACVLLSSHDLLGAIAQEKGGGFSLPVEPGGQEQREQALRLAINLAMYVLCLDYKDDQVHAEELMRRRGRQRR